jgi:rfaE bifunctional protein kinase chain/domain
MNLHRQLEDILKSFKQKKILIIGDVMVDEYLWGDVSRISPEAPVPVVSCTEKEHRMGGAANVAINVKAMEAQPVLCTAIGNDAAGKIFLRLVEEQKMDDEGIVESPGRITTVKTRVIGNHQHLLRVDHEITSFLDPELETQLLQKALHLFSKNTFDAVVFQDYDKGILTKRIIEEITKLSFERNIPILVDPKRRSFLSYKKVTLFKPNYKEFVEGLHKVVQKDDHQGLFEGARLLHKKNEIQNVMITLSDKGVFISNGETYRMIPAIKRDITDVSGAGDTVICIAALCIASGLDAFQTAVMANLAGGIVCEKVGVVPITPELFLLEKGKLH